MIDEVLCASIIMPHMDPKNSPGSVPEVPRMDPKNSSGSTPEFQNTSDSDPDSRVGYNIYSTTPEI
jgi:hypothetical protein